MMICGFNKPEIDNENEVIEKCVKKQWKKMKKMSKKTNLCKCKFIFDETKINIYFKEKTGVFYSFFLAVKQHFSFIWQLSFPLTTRKSSENQNE